MELLYNQNVDSSRLVESLSGQATRSSIFLLIAKVIRYSFVFIVQLILMNLLAPSDFGLIRFVTIIIGVINLINEMGLSFAIVQKKSLLESELASAFSLNALLGIGLYAIVFFLAPLCASYFGNCRLTSLIRVGALASFLGTLSVVHRGLLQRRFRFGRLAIIEICSAVTGSGCAVILAICGFGVWALLSSLFIFNSLSTLLLLTTISWPKGNYWNAAAAKSLCFFGVGVVIQRIIDYGAQNFDCLVVGKAFGEKVLGIYSISLTIINLPQLGFGVIAGSVLFSVFSRIQEDNKRLSQAFLRLNVLTSVISVPYYVFIFSFSREILHAVSFMNQSDKWLPAAVPLQILATLGLLCSFTSYPGMLWLSKGKLKLRIGWAIVMLFSIIIAVLIGRTMGINGICYALVVRGFIFFPVILIVTYRVIGLSPVKFIQTLGPAVICGFFMLAVTLSFSKFTSGASFGQDVETLVMGGAGGILIYFSVLLLFFKKTFKSFLAVVVSLIRHE